MYASIITGKRGMMVLSKPIARICYRNLIKLADAYAAATGANIKTVSRKAHSDPGFFEDIREGRISVTLRKYDQVIKWFARNWPEGVKRPTIKEPFK